MGRNTTTPLPSSLDRFSIGEVQDLSGVPNLYDAGTSKWLKSNTFTASSNVPDTTKVNIANSATGYQQIALASTLDDSYANACPYTHTEIARISASGITVYACSASSTAQQVLTVSSSGIQVVGTGLITSGTPAGVGATSLVVSDNTKFYQYGLTSLTTMGLYTSTNGTTWTSQAMTGLPSFNQNASNSRVFNTGSSSGRVPMGDFTCQVNAVTYGCFGVVWCGARFIFFAVDGSYYVAATSTNGYTWTADTANILGSATVAQGTSVFFYRNGNNCFIKIGATGAQRFTSDGGVTWSTMTTNAQFNSFNVDNSTTLVKRNTTDPAKLLMASTAVVGNTATISTNSGATFNTNISLPNLNNTYSALAWKGNTMLYTNYAESITLRISTDNGTTFTPVLLPAGTIGNSGQVYADATRFYFFPASSGQVLISTDGITWTIVALPTTEGGFSTYYGSGIVYYDTNKVVITDTQGYMALTTDGGVSWKVMAQSSTLSSTTNMGDLRSTADGGGFACGGIGNTGSSRKVFSGSSVTAGGAFYKVSSAAITPVRANAESFVRIA